MADDGERTFSAEVAVPNADARRTPVMSGKGKVSIGWRPAGYVSLRGATADLADDVKLDWLGDLCKSLKNRRNSSSCGDGGGSAVHRLRYEFRASRLWPHRRHRRCSCSPLRLAPSAQDAKSFSTSGPLVAEQQADVGAERDGRIVEIAVQIGDHVRARANCWPGSTTACCKRTWRRKRRASPRLRPKCATGRPSRRARAGFAPRRRSASRKNS